MRRKSKYPGLVAEMSKWGHTQKTIADLLKISVPGISKRLAGDIDWSISEVELICDYYKKNYYELFK